ncbi:MAG: hypothetical protein ACYTG5_02920 [Planctomycetota bacterium]|jgi:hypothetical protein
MVAIPKSLSLLLAASVFALGTVTAQDLEAALDADIAAKRAELVKLRFAELQPIQINGVELEPVLMKRELIHLVGHRLVEAKISEFFLEEQMQAAIEGGRKPEEFEVTEEEVMADMAGVIAQARASNPDIKFWDAIRAVYGMEKDVFMENTRKTKLFDKVFFPGNPEDWPTITQEAIASQSSPGQGGADFWNALLAQTQGKEMPPFLLSMCRQWVLDQLRAWSEIEFPAHGLPPEVCVRVNGRDWPTDEAFEQVKASVFPQDLERAMLEVIINEVVRQELVAKDAYLSDEEFTSLFSAYRKIYDDTAFPLQQIVTAYKGYPSLEAYRRRWRLIRSYENLIEAETTDYALKEYGKEHVRFFRNASTNVDLIPFLGVDVDSGAWVPGGMEKARERADAAMAEIEAGTDFVQVLESRGEFFKTDEVRGRLGGKGYNQLRQAVFENEFNELQQGFSMAYFLYNHAEVGKTYGPLKSVKAWYIARINSKVPVQGVPDMSQEGQRNLVKQDFVVHRFHRWANELIAKAKVE